MENQKLLIQGGARLSGEIALQGAKNSALPILAAAALCDGETVLTNCPRLTDVYAACRILTQLGCQCRVEDDCVRIRNTGLTSCVIPDALMREMRSSIMFLGAVLGKTGSCTVSLPGGCELGPRPIDMHLEALRRMSVTVTDHHGSIEARADPMLCGARITLPFPSVGATENVMLAAVLAKGETVLCNAAQEPELADLGRFLCACGAKIRGAGESTVIIEGVERLHGTQYAIMPDRIAAATYIAAAAVTSGTLCITGANASDLEAVLCVMEQMGCHIYTYPDRIYVHAQAPMRSPKMVRTMPYPGFPTDAQALVMTAACHARGTCLFEETIFENRYQHVDELLRMGADIQVSGRAAVVRGVPRLYGAKVHATDLRGGAALVVAGLCAEGTTELGALHHIDRGYAQIETVLTGVGANIRRT